MAKRPGKEGASFGGKMLEKLAQYHEQKAATLRAAIAVLNEHTTRSSSRRAGTTFAAALELDAARRSNGHGSNGHAPGYGAVTTVKERRKRSEELLAVFDTETPREAPEGRGQGLAVLVLHGYLKKKKNGYIRTTKPFSV